MSRVLQLVLLLLVGFCQAAPSGKVPISQLRMLALGLAHLLQGVEEDVQRLEQQGALVGAQLDVATQSLEGLRKQSLQAGRTHRQVRKDLQIQTARRDRLWKTIRDLQKEMKDLETEQGAVQVQMNRIIQALKSLTEPRSRGHAETDTSYMKLVVDKQARQIANLTSEVSTRDRIINRRLQLIKHLEKRLPSGAWEPPGSTQGRLLP